MNMKLVILVFSVSFLSGLDKSITNVALPALMKVFGTSVETIQWINLAFNVANIAILLEIGKLLDFVNKMKIFLLGIIGFVAASALCAYSTTIEFLVVSRFLQGTFASVMGVSGIAILGSVAPDEKKAYFFGLNTSIFTIGMISGPVIGGVIVDNWEWNNIFLINIPLGIIILSLVASVYRELRSLTKPADSASKSMLDYKSYLLFLVATASLTIIVSFIPSAVISNSYHYILALAFAMIAAGYLYLRRQSTLKQKSLNFKNLSNHLFKSSIVANFFANLSIGASLIIWPFYLIYISKFSNSLAGGIMGTLPFVLIFLHPIVGKSVKKYNPVNLCLYGLILYALSFAAFIILPAIDNPIYFVLAILPLTLGVAAFASPNAYLVMNSFSPDKQGEGSGLLNFSYNFGQTLGVALASAVMAFSQTMDEAGKVIIQTENLLGQIKICYSILTVGIIVGIYQTLKYQNQAAKEKARDNNSLAA